MKLEQTIEFFASIGVFMEIERALVVVLEDGEEVRVRKVDGEYVVMRDYWVDGEQGKRVVFE